MVCIQLKDRHGYLTSQSCRSSMLHYRSDLVHVAKLIVFSPLYVLGAQEEKQTLYFELYNDFEEDQVKILFCTFPKGLRRTSFYRCGFFCSCSIIQLRMFTSKYELKTSKSIRPLFTSAPC
jgi:seipin